jgi:hypothetical protein
MVNGVLSKALKVDLKFGTTGPDLGLEFSVFRPVELSARRFSISASSGVGALYRGGKKGFLTCSGSAVRTP